MKIPNPGNKENEPFKDTKIKVYVDRDLEDLIPGFLANRNRDILSIMAALERQDYTTIETLGHWMKGAGAGYGFEELSEIGKRLEQAAGAADRTQIQNAIHDLEQYLNHIDIQYE